MAITRPKDKAEETVGLVKARGWEALIVPTVELRPREKALEGIDLEDYDWLVVTSSAGAVMALRHFKEKAKKVNIACIGPRTAAEVEKMGYRVAFTPTKYEASALAKELLERGAEGKRILVARASSGREVLIKVLKTRAKVREVFLYDTVMVRDKKGIEDFKRALRDKTVDAVIFTSSHAAKNLLSELDEDSSDLINSLLVCAIGPITADTLKRSGIKVDIIPEEYTVKSCLEELAVLENRRRKS